MHKRQEIREAVVALLKAAPATDAGSSVFESRMAPLNKHQLPSIIVYTESETVAEDSKTTAPRELDRRLVLAIEGCVRATDDVDDAIDTLALQIETRMCRDSTLGDLVSDLILSSTEIELFEENKQRVAAIKLLYDVRYFTYAPDAADVELDDFATAHVEINLAGAQEGETEPSDGDGDTAKDDLELPQT